MCYNVYVPERTIFNKKGVKKMKANFYDDFCVRPAVFNYIVAREEGISDNAMANLLATLVVYCENPIELESNMKDFYRTYGKYGNNVEEICNKFDFLHIVQRKPYIIASYERW